MSGRKIKIDFASRMQTDENQQQLFTRYAANEKPPGRSLHWRLDRALTASGLTGASLLLGRALALHMHQDNDGIWYARVKRRAIMETAAISSISTYKKYMPEILVALGIQAERTGRALRFVWRIGEGQDTGNRTTDAGALWMESLPALSDEEYVSTLIPIAKKLIACFEPILKRVGLTDEKDLVKKIHETCMATPRASSITHEKPWLWFAHLEARLEEGLPHPATYAAAGLLGLSSMAKPDPNRVDELRVIYESMPDEPNAAEDVG